MKALKVIGIVILGMAVISCEYDIGDNTNPQISDENVSYSSTKESSETNCSDILTSKSSDQINLYTLNGVYDNCNRLINDDIVFSEYLFANGTFLNQVSLIWSSFDGTEDLDSLIFDHSGRRLDFYPDRTKLRPETLIYLSNDIFERHGLRMNYIELDDCENGILKLQEGVICLIEKVDC